MKKLVLFLSLITVFSCSKDDAEPKEVYGCVLATNKSSQKEVWITCGTKEKWDSNYWKTGDFAVYYEKQRFVVVSDCEECKQYPR